MMLKNNLFSKLRRWDCFHRWKGGRKRLGDEQARRLAWRCKLHRLGKFKRKRLGGILSRKRWGVRGDYRLCCAPNAHILDQRY